MTTLDTLLAQIQGRQAAVTGTKQDLEGAPTGADFAEQLRGRLTRPEDMENLIKNIAQNRARLQAIPAETRAQAPIGAYSPTQVAGLIAERQEPVRATEETLRGVKTAREGRLEDIIGRATKGYEAQIEKAQNKYNQAYQQLQDLVEEKRWIQQQTTEATRYAEESKRYTAEQAEDTRRWEAQMALAEREGKPTRIEELKEDIGQALFGGAYGTTFATREELIEALVVPFSDIPRAVIAAEVYKFIPDIPGEKVIAKAGIQGLPGIAFEKPEMKTGETPEAYFKRTGQTALGLKPPVKAVAGVYVPPELQRSVLPGVTGTPAGVTGTPAFFKELYR